MSTIPVNYEMVFPVDKLIKLAEAYNAFYEEDSSVTPLKPQELTLEQIQMLIDLYTDWLNKDFDECLDDMSDNEAFIKDTSLSIQSDHNES